MGTPGKIGIQGLCILEEGSSGLGPPAPCDLLDLAAAEHFRVGKFRILPGNGRIILGMGVGKFSRELSLRDSAVGVL